MLKCLWPLFKYRSISNIFFDKQKKNRVGSYAQGTASVDIYLAVCLQRLSYMSRCTCSYAFNIPMMNCQCKRYSIWLSGLQRALDRLPSAICYRYDGYLLTWTQISRRERIRNCVHQTGARDGIGAERNDSYRSKTCSCRSVQRKIYYFAEMLSLWEYNSYEWWHWVLVELSQAVQSIALCKLVTWQSVFTLVQLYYFYQFFVWFKKNCY